MKRIIILRHAKAEKLAATDHERPLSARGHEQAQQCSTWISALPFAIESAIVSSSMRTTQTWQDLHLHCPALTTDDAYNASAEQWVHLIRECGQEVNTLLIVGHNPGVSDLAFAHGYAGELSTCAAVVIELKESWQQFGLQGGRTAQTFVPERSN